jgi:hypothetical protein
MIRNLFFFLSFAAVIGACSTLGNPKDKDNSKSKKIEIENQVCFNHSLLVLDSATYDAVVNSEFLSRFAFSYEKNLTGYQGFYLIGETNYLEMFHPNSFEGEQMEHGTIWICLASLKANYLEQLNKEELDFIEFESDDDYNYLSLMIDDSINPITTWEMRRNQFESWTKKEYNDSITFLPVDYNNPQESDSSSNYLMNEVYGIGLSLNPTDSLKVISYLKEIGYDSYSVFNGHTRLSNNEQFVELHILKDINSLSINRYYIQLNKFVRQSTEVIGSSRIECDGKSATWIFE